MGPIVVLVGIVAALAQESPSVRFVDTGPLMSTPSLAPDTAWYQTVMARGGQLAPDILRWSHESTWPAGIATLEARNAHRTQMNDYRATLVVDLGDAAVVRIAAAEQGHMPADMRPDHDIYWIIGKRGFTVVGSAPNLGPAPTPAAAVTGFDAVLDTWIRGLANNFADLIGAERKDDGPLASLSHEFDTRLPVPGASDTKIYQQLGGARSMNASFGKFRSAAEGRAAQDALVAKINAAKLPCCTLVATENDLDTVRSVAWLPFDLAGRMKGYDDMVLEVQLLKLLGFDENYKSFDEWHLTLAVYHQR